MAYPNEIQIGRLNQILHKLLAMEEGSPSPQLTGEIAPIIVLENDRPEWKFLGGESLLMGKTFGTGAAGQLMGCQLLNPTGSGTLVVIERVYLCSTTSQTVGGGFENTSIGAASAGDAQSTRDTRRQPILDLMGVAQLRRASAAASVISGPIVVNLRALANAINEINLDIVLAPGTGFMFEAGSVATEIKVNWFWRERPLEASEVR